MEHATGPDENDQLHTLSSKTSELRLAIIEPTLQLAHLLFDRSMKQLLLELDDPTPQPSHLLESTVALREANARCAPPRRAISFAASTKRKRSCETSCEDAS